MLSNEIPVPLRWISEYFGAVSQRAEGDEFFLSGDAGPAFFGAEAVLPLRFLRGGLGEECLARCE
jgi:hypothetical protein